MEENIRDNKKEKSGGITLRDVFEFFVCNWYWFVISVVVFACAGYVVYKVLPREYYTSAMIYVDEEYSRGLNMDVTNLTANRMFRQGNTVENEVYFLKSRSMMNRVVEREKANVRYHFKSTFREIEFYRLDSPVELVLDTIVRPFSLKVHLGDDGYRATMRYKTNPRRKVTETFYGRYGEPAGDELAGCFRLVPRKDYFDSYREGVGDYIHITVESPRAAAERYARDMSVSTASRGTSIIALSLRDPVAQKVADIVNGAISEYNNDAVEGKRQTAQSTLRFIDERLAMVENDLGGVDARIERFQTEHSSVNTLYESRIYLEAVTRYKEEAVKVEIQALQLEGMEEMLDDDQIRPLPVNLGIQDVALTAGITRYNELVMQRMRFDGDRMKDNPIVRELDVQIRSMQSSLRESIRAVHSATMIQRGQVNAQLEEAIARMTGIPAYEKETVAIRRDQEIKAALYAFLLNKREETAMKMASTASIARVVDPAMAYSIPILPKRTLVLGLFLLLGLLLPVLVLYLRENLRSKVARVSEVEDAVTVPILGALPSKEDPDGGDMIVSRDSRDAVTEAFRMVRTNIDFVMPAGGQVIMVTSAMPGEGKSYVSINLALSLAITGRRVVLMDLDLRKSTLAERITGKRQPKGITNFLAGREDDIMELVDRNSTAEIDMLFVGAIPPNPAELLLGERLDKAVAQLRANYDYVIIDTAPIGLVADTMSANRVADLTLFSVRIGHTDKRSLQAVDSLRDRSLLKNVNLIITDADASTGYTKYGKYGTAYGYGYGYGYTDEKRKGHGRRLRIKSGKNH